MTESELVYQLYFIEKQNLKETCKKCGIGEKRFYKILAENGWKTRRSNVSKKRLQYCNHGWLYHQYIVLQKSCKQIGDEINIGETTINCWLAKFNIDCRDKSEINKGRKFNDEWKDKLSKAKIGKYAGENHPNWKGGKSMVKSRINHNLRDYKKWRKSVLKKDGYKCVICNSENNLHCHHIIPMHISFDLAFNVNNGIVLCKSCHNLAHTRKDVSGE